MTTDDRPLPRVTSGPSRMLVFSVLSVVAAATVTLFKALDPDLHAFKIAYLIFAAWMLTQTVLGMFDRPRRGTGSSHPRPSVTALVPVYNEDPAAVKRCLRGFLEQTHRPDAVVAINDGSTITDGYHEVRDWFLGDAWQGIRTHWIDTENQGKRHAQIEGFLVEPNDDIYVTVDSDSILDSVAIEQALLAFEDSRVQSVAATILSTNYGTNLLTRLMDVYTVSLQLFERSAFSRAGAVLVNSGGCAFYRRAIIGDNIDRYLGETLFGKSVPFSDDSLLTLFALERGQAIQQSTCFAFTLMPDRLSHHLRQQVRWMRGSFIRSGWRFRFLPLSHPAYWFHFAKWIAYMTLSLTLLLLIVEDTDAPLQAAVPGILAALALYGTTTLRYLAIRRTDQSSAQRAITYLSLPVAAAWGLTSLRIVRWYGMLTFWILGWGTRSAIEVREEK